MKLHRAKNGPFRVGTVLSRMEHRMQKLPFALPFWFCRQMKF